MPACMQHAGILRGLGPTKVVRGTLPWRALRDISSTKIHWSTFYNITTQIYCIRRALFEPPPAQLCVQISACRASGSVIYVEANDWLSILASGLVWRPR